MIEQSAVEIGAHQELTSPCVEVRPTSIAPASCRPGMGIIGVGAFGEFCIPHLREFFNVHLCDPRGDLAEVAARYDADIADIATAARQDIVLLAAPLRELPSVARRIAAHLRAGSLVVDVCSIKTRPLAILVKALPPHVDIIGTHPLFGPQSGRHGIRGLRIALCPVRGRRAPILARFLRDKLGLKVIWTTAEEHDRQMAHVQGLTHLIARIVLAMDVPRLDHTTTTFDHLMQMVETVRYDSDELFRTIAADNPFVDEVKQRFLEATRRVVQTSEAP